MNWYNSIKRYHEKGYWTNDMVKVAVVANKITVTEYKEITGEDFAG